MIPLDPSPEPEKIMQGTVSSRETAKESVAPDSRLAGVRAIRSDAQTRASELRAIDARVASEVMGWGDVQLERLSYHTEDMPTGVPPTKHQRCVVSRFASDPGASYSVLEKLVADGWTAHIDCTPECAIVTLKYGATIENGDGGVTITAIASAVKPWRAICQAALDARLQFRIASA